MIEELEELLRVGGAQLMAVRGNPRSFRAKRSQSDLVTDADSCSEEAILERLAQLAPEDGFISEEAGLRQGRSDRMWIIDPLDGTSNYGAGLDDFGVIVGVIEAGVRVAGGMHLPAHGLTYLASLGGGATRNGEAIHASTTAVIEEAFIDHSLAHLEPILREQEQTLAALIRRARAIRCNHSLRYLCYVAEGVYDAFVYHSLGLWDLVGPSVILAEAGVRLSRLDGTALDLRPTEDASTTLYGAVGANPVLHAELLRVLTEALTSGASARE